MDPQVHMNKNGRMLLMVLLVVLVVIFGAKMFHCGDRGGFGALEHQIAVEGKGEVSAVPDAASFNYSVFETAATVAEAQAKATTKSNAILAYLKEAAIEERDIRTQDYSINPEYVFRPQICNAQGCTPGRQSITGYQVNQTVMVKVRDTAKAGDILTGIGTRGASNVSSLSFTLDEERQEELQAEARKLAIANAREKAEDIARDLGVHVKDVISFTESNQGQPYPYYEMKAMDGVANAGGVVPAPELPTGQNKVISTVSVLFEIR